MALRLDMAGENEFQVKKEPDTDDTTPEQPPAPVRLAPPSPLPPARTAPPPPKPMVPRPPPASPPRMQETEPMLMVVVDNTVEEEEEEVERKPVIGVDVVEIVESPNPPLLRQVRILLVVPSVADPDS